MSFNIKAKIEADGSGYLREVSKVALANEALEAKIAQRAFDKLDHAGKLKVLRQQELDLANKAFALEAKGDAAGAKRATLAMLEKQEQRERLITSEKEKQAAAEAKSTEAKKRQADAAERARRATTISGLRHGPGSSAKAEKGLAGMGGELASGALAGFGVPLGAAAVAGGAIAALRGALQFADEVSDSSEQMGVSVAEFQKLEIAAGRAGLSIGDFQTALSQIDTQRREAAEGNEELQAQFARFGVTLQELNNPAMRHMDILRKIAEQTRNVDSAGRAAMKQLLGRRGDRLGGALGEFANVGDDEIVSDGAIKRLDSVNSKLEMAGKTMKNWGIEALAFWDDVAEKLAKAAYFMVDKNVARAGAAESREDRARRAFRIDDAAGLRGDGMSREAQLFSQWANRPESQRGQTFEEFAKGQDEQEAKRLFTNKTNKKLQADIAEIVAKRGMIGLTHAEKELKLKEEIAALELEMQWAEDETGRLRVQKAMEEKRNALAELEAKPENDNAARATSRSPERNVDSLARIGLFLGGAPQGLRVQPLTGPEAARLNAQLLRELRAVERAVRKWGAWA